MLSVQSQCMCITKMVTVAQKVFQCYYEIPARNEVSSAHAIKTWVRNFEETGSVLKKTAEETNGVGLNSRKH